jgi:uncharacterized protein (DUF2249 family)/quercetin dioxygenase-like cupin family protein
MQKHNLQQLIEFDNASFLPRVIHNQPGFRLVLLNLRTGQSVPEHSTSDRVAVYALSGHITFYENQSPADLRAGEMVTIEAGAPHRLEAHEDSSLLVIRAGDTAPSSQGLDLRQVPRPQRHPLVFETFDRLNVDDSMILVNDHDPVPLHMQMENLRSGQFAWEYIIRGPEIFRIRVRRTAPPTGAETPLSVPSTTVVGIRSV